MKCARLLCILGVAVPAACLAQTDLKIMTWNIDRAVGSNGPTTSEQTAVAKIVNYEHPDVWNIQELGGNNSGYSAPAEQSALVSFINSDITIFGANPQLNSSYYVYVGTYTDSYISDAIVTRYPILSMSAHNDGERGMYEATLSLPGGVTAGVFTTHLKADSTTTDAEDRQTEAEGDVTFMNGWKSANPNLPYFLTGDFNESEDPDNTPNWSGGIGGTLPNGDIYHPITTLKSVGLNDPIPVTIRGHKNTESSRQELPNIRFDYNLYSPGVTYLGGEVFDTAQFTSTELAALNAANGTNFVASDSSSATDHLPVVATYQLAPVPEPISLGGLAVGVIGLLARRRRQSR